MKIKLSTSLVSCSKGKGSLIKKTITRNVDAVRLGIKFILSIRTKGYG